MGTHRRREKPAAEPKRTSVKPVPKPTQSGNDKYCTVCETWYKPGERSQHEHGED